MGSTGAQLPFPSRARGPGGQAAAEDPVARTPSGPVAISARGLRKSYHAGVAGCAARVEAVRDVDLDVAAGEAVGILGPVGAGKSTLLLCLAGLLRLDRGSVSWFGCTADDSGRPPGIAYVPERGAHYAFMTVREALEYHALLRDTGGDDRATAIEDALEVSGLTAVAGARIGELPWSIGPRLSLAQALIDRPRVLLMDETLSGADPQTRRDLGLAINALVAAGMSVVASAESLDALNGLTTRVAVMVDGRITGEIDPALQCSRFLELSVATPAIARRILGARVAEDCWDRQLLRLPLEGTTPEAILARCRASGIRVEASRVVVGIADDHRADAAEGKHSASDQRGR